MRCTLRGFAVDRRMASNTTGPMVMLGTNRPSITSMWIQSAPAASAARTSSPKRAKSADKIEGAMRIGDAPGERTLEKSASGFDFCWDMLLDFFDLHSYRRGGGTFEKR